MASIPIAFGIRYRGLRRVADYLNVGLDYFARVIAKYSTPFPVGLFSKNFRNEAEKMEEELLDWIRSKNRGVRNMQDAPISINLQEKKEKFIGRLWKDFIESLGLNEKPQNGGGKSTSDKNKRNTPATDENTPPPEPTDDIKYRIHNLELDAFEKHNFPDYDKKITALKHEYDEIRTQNQVSTWRINKIEKGIDDTVKKIFDLQNSNTRVVSEAMMQNMAQKVWILEGFELGHWYLENKIFPERVCPPMYTPPPPDRPQFSGNGEGDGHAPEVPDEIIGDDIDDAAISARVQPPKIPITPPPTPEKVTEDPLRKTPNQENEAKLDTPETAIDGDAPKKEKPDEGETSDNSPDQK
jgi:hypothetical protein